MKVAKVLVFFTTVIMILLLGVFGLIRLVNSGALSIGFWGESDTADEVGSNITLPNLLGQSISGELIILTNSVNGSKIVGYKISTGRQKLIVSLEDIKISDPEENIQLIGDEIYLLGKRADNLVIAKTGTSPNSELEILLEQPSSKESLGLRIIEDQLAFTSYSEDEAGTYMYEIAQVSRNKKEDEELTLSSISNGESDALFLVSKFSTKENIYLEAYFPNYRMYLDSCLDLKQKEIDCFTTSGAKIAYFSNSPGLPGFTAGQNATISKIDKDETKVILEGTLNKYFSSLVTNSNEIYFISGNLESLIQDEESGESYFTEFEPVYLEKFDTKKSTRTELANLPASTDIRIAAVENDFVILSVLQDGQNSLWMYNIDKTSLEEIDDIECVLVSGCDNFLISSN